MQYFKTLKPRNENEHADIMGLNPSGTKPEYQLLMVIKIKIHLGFKCLSDFSDF